MPVLRLFVLTLGCTHTIQYTRTVFVQVSCYLFSSRRLRSTCFLDLRVELRVATALLLERALVVFRRAVVGFDCRLAFFNGALSGSGSDFWQLLLKGDGSGRKHTTMISAAAAALTHLSLQSLGIERRGSSLSLIESSSLSESSLSESSSKVRDRIGRQLKWAWPVFP